MTDREYSPVRWLHRPRKVYVDPRRIWTLPARPAHREGPPTLGQRAIALNTRLDQDWIEGTQYAWCLFAFGRNFEWMAEIAVDLSSRSGAATISVRQWVPWDAIRLPENTG
jgi:hypothetical protein